MDSVINSNLNISISPKVVVIGCGFRAFTSQLLRYWNKSGNYYNNQVDLPAPTSNRLFAHGRFSGLSSTPGIYRGFNVTGIIKNGTGDYTITFQFPSIINEKIPTVGMDRIGFTQVISETTKTIHIKCWTANGTTSIDPAQLSFHSYE